MTPTPLSSTEAQGPILTRATHSAQSARGDTWSKRTLGRFHVTGTFWVRALMWVARGSEFRAVTMVWLWSAIFFFFLIRARRIVARHLDHIIGRAGFWRRQARIFRFFKEHAWALVERFEQFRPDFRPTIELGSNRWPDLLADPKGFLIVTAHVGMWEIGQLLPVTDGKRRLHVVREREDHEGTQQLVADLLASHPHVRIVTHFLDDDLALGASLLSALRGGDVVCLAGDRAKTGMVTLPAKCFGHPVQMPAGPMALARAADVLVVPTFVYRVGRRHYRIVANDAFRVARTGDRQQDLQQAVDRLAAEIEGAIRHDPYQWKRFEPLW